MKKIVKTIGVVVVTVFVVFGVLLFWLTHKQSSPNQYWKQISTSANIESKYNHLGSFDVKNEIFEAPQDSRDKHKNHFMVWYPKEEGKYPLLVMVNGTGVIAQKYKSVFEHIASWGYVVIGNDYGTNWDGKHASETLDFALGLKEINKKIDREKIAIGGHSQGGMGTFNAITEYDNGRLYKVAFSISPTNDDLAISLKWGFQLESTTPYAFQLDKINIPMMIIAGTGKFDNETVSPLSKMQEEFKALTGDKVMFRRADKADHGNMLYEANSYVIAWLDYYLKGNLENEAAFYGNRPEISVNARYQDFDSIVE